MNEMSGKEEPPEEAILEGDRGYFTEKNLKAAKERRVKVIIPDQQFCQRDGHFDGRPEHGGKGRFRVEDVEYDEGEHSYRCPAKKKLGYKGHVQLNRNSREKYQAKSSDCKECALQQQ
ncbi:MAG: IS1182 family transposase, partial [Treponema sp.]|nr:IS1182 family transposase [Treponema sp.]